VQFAWYPRSRFRLAAYILVEIEDAAPDGIAGARVTVEDPGVARAEIQARNFDLKAVNLNAKVEEDRRTPAELLNIIEAKQKGIAAVIAALRSQN
jgi:hypothetical protein